MNKRISTALAATTLAVTTAIVGASSGHALQPGTPLCEGAYPYTNTPCKTVETVTWVGDGQQYVIAYYHGVNGQTHVINAETTLPRR